GEQGSDRTVDHARGEGLLLVRAALPLEETAGDLSGGVGVLAVIDGERQKAHAGPLLALRRGGDQHHGVAVAHGDGAVGLLGDLAGLDGQGSYAEIKGACAHETLSSVVPRAPQARALVRAGAGAPGDLWKAPSTIDRRSGRRRS